jgi:hypothetical protein
MENSKKILEMTKNFPIENILKKDSYIILLLNENSYQGYIKDIKNSNKYDIVYLDSPDKITSKYNLTTKEITFFGSNYLQNNNNIREIYLNEKLKDIGQDNDLTLMILNKLRELFIDINIINDEIDKFNVEQNKYLFYG